MEYNSLKITDEEKESLQAYCGYEHRYINLLTSGNIDTINKLNNEGLNSFSTGYFLKGMEILKNIYSAIVKYSYNGNGLRNLVRGTTLAEIEYMQRNDGICNKLLSTTESELAAKQHGGSKVMLSQDPKDKTNVVLRIHSTDEKLLYINVNNVLKEESNYEREEEFIIAPFCKLTDIKHVSSWDGYEYYGANIEGQKLEKVENMEELFKYASENIGDILEFVRLYTKKKEECETFQDIMHYEKHEEDKRLLRDRIDSAQKEMDEAEGKFNALREKIVECAKGICYEAKEKVEKELEAEKAQMGKEKTEQSKQELNNSLDTIRQSTEALGIQTSKYERIAKEFDIPWNTGMSQGNIAQLYNEIQETGKKFSEQLVGNLTIEEIDKIQTRVSRIAELSNDIKESLDNGYDDNSCLNQIKQELNDKIDDLIKQSKIQRINEDIKRLEGERVGIVGKIFGRDKKIELQKQQLVLRKKLLEVDSTPEQGEVDENEMLAKILYYGKQNNDEIPKPLETVFFQIKKTFEVDYKKVATIMAEKTEQTALMIVDEDMFKQKRQSNKTLMEINNMLEEEIQMAQQTSNEQYRNGFKTTGTATSVPEVIWRNMKSVEYVLNHEEDKLLEIQIGQESN